MGAPGRNRKYAELAEIYEELEQAKKLHRRLRCPVIDISELSIEETAHRILRVVEERRIERKRGHAVTASKEPGVVVVASGGLALLVGDILFYVLLTPVWIGLRTLAWIADWRRRSAAGPGDRSDGAITWNLTCNYESVCAPMTTSAR